jgi:ferritin-like metal-binding protein YciE
MATEALRELFIEELKDIYDAEHRITQALPKLAKAAHSHELISAFEDHLRQTQEQVNRLEQVLDALEEPLARKTCKAMVGLIAEGEEMMKINGTPGIRDAALIAAAQKVEHYEMATYGCLRTWAHLLNEDEAERLLQESLDEEGETDKRLTEIAESLPLEGAAEGNGHDRQLDEDREHVMEAESPSVARNTRTASTKPGMAKSAKKRRTP